MKEYGKIEDNTRCVERFDTKYLSNGTFLNRPGSGIIKESGPRQSVIIGLIFEWIYLRCFGQKI